jgi:hypothetical protein
MISYKKIDGKHCVVDEKGKTLSVCPTKKAAMFFVDMQSAYYEAIDVCTTPIMYYFEYDLADSDDGYTLKYCDTRADAESYITEMEASNDSI